MALGLLSPLLCATLVVAELEQASGQGRSLHWVIRVSHLEATLEFTKSVLGMQVLRHEENDAACPITCNGQYDTRWSKTMVGYGREDTAYALELTFNYGVPGYEKGEGLQRFVIEVGDTVSALAHAKDM